MPPRSRWRASTRRTSRSTRTCSATSRAETVQAGRLLEIGLGYGTLGEALARRGANYHGLDLAEGPGRDDACQACPRSRREARAGEARLGARAAVRRRAPSTTWSPSAACTTRATFSARVAECRRVLRPGGRLVADGLQPPLRAPRAAGADAGRAPSARARERRAPSRRCATSTTGMPTATPHLIPTSSPRASCGVCCRASATSGSSGAVSTACRSARSRSRGCD